MPVELPRVPAERAFRGREAQHKVLAAWGGWEGAAKTFRGRFAPAKPPPYGHFWKLLGQIPVPSDMATCTLFSQFSYPPLTPKKIARRERKPRRRFWDVSESFREPLDVVR